MSLVLPNISNGLEVFAQESTVADGEYAVVSKGHSDGLELSVSFENGVISNVEVVSHNETKGISNAKIVIK